MKPLIVWGATGQAVVLQEFIGHAGYEIVALFDNDPDARSPIPNAPLYTGEEGFRAWEEGWREGTCSFLVAIGGDKGACRREISEWLRRQGMIPASVRHPSSSVATDAQLGDGAQVLMNAAVGARCLLGDYCIVNTSSSVDHECCIGAGCHIGPGATLAGLVTLGENVFIGAGATILPRIVIGDNSVVGAGAVVTHDVPDQSIVCGVPAKVMGSVSKK